VASPLQQSQGMKNSLALFVAGLAVLGSIGAGAQIAPDFTGTWKMDPSRSVLAAQATPSGPMDVTIRQNSDEVRIETTQNGTTAAVRYFPESMKRTPAGSETIGTFRWEGLQLVTDLETSINNQAVTVNEIRALNSEGTEMTVTTTLVVQHGYTSGGGNPLESKNASNTSTGTNVFLRAR
jgi:hypothetical protein